MTTDRPPPSTRSPGSSTRPRVGDLILLYDFYTTGEHFREVAIATGRERGEVLYASWWRKGVVLARLDDQGDEAGSEVRMDLASVRRLEYSVIEPTFVGD